MVEIQNAMTVRLYTLVVARRREELPIRQTLLVAARSYISSAAEKCKKTVRKRAMLMEALLPRTWPNRSALGTIRGRFVHVSPRGS